MVDRIPWRYIECAAFIGACIATGAVIGVARVLAEMMGERREDHHGHA